MLVKRLSRLGFVLGVLAMMLTIAPVAADRVFHTTRIDLHPVADAPLDSGFIVHTHANGPNVFAHDIYSLKGAIPNTTFQMQINVYVDDTTCSDAPAVSLIVDEFTTNGVGNATGDLFVPPELIDALGLHNIVGAELWHVLRDGEIVYASDCLPGATD